MVLWPNKPSRKPSTKTGQLQAIDQRSLAEAVDSSLNRLQVDYIDLYQIHWPDRYVPSFGKTLYDPAEERPTVPIAEQLEAMQVVIQAGKVCYVVVSNETPWGVMEFVAQIDEIHRRYPNPSLWAGVLPSPRRYI